MRKKKKSNQLDVVAISEHQDHLNSCSQPSKFHKVSKPASAASITYLSQIDQFYQKPDPAVELFLKLKCTIENEEMTSSEIINKLKSSIKKSTNNWSFISENKKLIEELVYLGLFKQSKSLLGPVCDLIIPEKRLDKPCSKKWRLSVGKLKTIFRKTYRRSVLTPCCKESLFGLSAKILVAVKDMNCGENDFDEKSDIFDSFLGLK